MVAFLYILRCRDGSYYVGTARDSLERRIAQHQDGTFGGFTALRRPVELVFHQEFERITDAIAAERQVKGWRREKKETLIAGAFDLLPVLSRRKGGWHERGASFETAAPRPPQDEEGQELQRFRNTPSPSS